MYITCLDNEIEKALRTVLKSTSKVSSLPVLQYIHIHTEKNKLILRGTNLELGVEVSIPATVTTEGEMILSPELFLSVVSGAKGNTIELKEISGNLEVKSTTSKTLIKAVKGDDFPTLPTIDNGNTLTINTQTLADGFKSVLFSASNSTVKQELASILVYIEASVLYFVATDSFRLAEKKRSISGDISLSKILIPAKNAQEIIRIIEAIDADAQFSVNENQLAISCEGVYITSRLIEGTYPDYTQIIPKESMTEATFLSKDFIDILKKSVSFSGKFNKITITIDPKKSTCSISSESNDVGSHSSFISGAVSGEPVTAHFNHKYLTDMISVVGTDSISLSFYGSGKPLMVRPVGDEGFLYLVMQMNS